MSAAPTAGADFGSSEPSAAHPCYSDRCQKCGVGLRIVDDLAPSADIASSFRGNVNESFVVVPSSDPDEFVVTGGGRRDAHTAMGQTGSDRTDEKKPQCASLDEVVRVEKIMAFAIGQTDQDHPVCADCLKNVVAEVQRLVFEAEEEHRIYQEALSGLTKQMQDPDFMSTDQLEAELADLGAEEQSLLEQLKDVEREEREVQDEIDRLRRQEDTLQREEDEFWLEFAEYQLDLDEDAEERAATESSIRYASSELNRLQRSNVLNDMFHIAPHGQYGTISKFRMGRLLEQPAVPWEEINAAWGQACLLLDALVKRCGVPMAQYRLLPRGSFSAIQVGGEVLQLYSSDGGLRSFFVNRHFDLAMTAFLSCLKEVTKFLQRDPSLRLPFKIEGDKVGGFSVRVLFNPPERWTKALKYMLADLKWLIAFEARESENRGASATRAL